MDLGGQLQQTSTNSNNNMDLGRYTFSLGPRESDWSKAMLGSTCLEVFASAHSQMLFHGAVSDEVRRQLSKMIESKRPLPPPPPAAATLPPAREEDDTEKEKEGGELELVSNPTAPAAAASVVAPITFSSAAPVAPVSAAAAATASAGVPVQLHLRTGATDKFKFLLNDFLRALLLGVRTLFDDNCSAEVAYSNAAEFLKTVLNVGANGADPESPEPDFLNRQTLGEVVAETVGRLKFRHAFGNKQDLDDEMEELTTLFELYARHIVVVLLSFGFATTENPASNSDAFQKALSLLAVIISKKKGDYDVVVDDQLRGDSFVEEDTSSSGSD